MKTNPDPDPEEALLEALLRDDDWRAANAAGKAAALGVFQARQRVRRLTRWGGGAAVLAAAAVCASHWMAGPAGGTPRSMARKTPEAIMMPEKAPYLTDDELIALFPPGSCFLAEVDGKMKLVFLDPKVERQYVSDASGRRSFAP